VLSLRRLFPVLLLVSLAFPFLKTARAQTSVTSQFLPRFGDYSRPANWSPAEVPNNTAEREYHVLLPQNAQLRIDTDATVSSLTQPTGDNSYISVEGRTFRVTGGTQIGRPRITITGYGDGGLQSGLFDAGSFSAFAEGSLTGDFAIYSEATPATLQFRGANIKALRNATLTIHGTAASIVDENGADALRNLAVIDADSRLEVSEHVATTQAPLKIDGHLEVKGSGTPATIFNAAGSLTNFDAATRTLSGGEFVLQGGNDPVFGAGIAELRFANADIVNNASNLTLRFPASRIADHAGVDALRNFARNLSGGSLTLDSRDFSTAGDFTNEGTLTVQFSTFAVGGKLTNFDPATRTLRGGKYILTAKPNENAVPSPALTFRGADIVNNEAYLEVERGAMRDEAGNDALRNFSNNLAGGTFVLRPYYREFGDNRADDFVAAGDFTNAGRLEITEAHFGSPFFFPASAAFIVPAGAKFTQTAGYLLNLAILAAPQIEIKGGTLASFGSITGNVTITGGTVVPGGSMHGNLTLTAESRVRSSIGERRSFSSWRRITGDVTLDGTLEVTVRHENFLPQDAVLTLLQSDGTVSGHFSNAPDGARLTTADGSGSFVVRYDGKSVKLTDYQPSIPTAQLLNISTRGYLAIGGADTSNRFLIAGFMISGTAPKTVAIRALGPALGARGITAALRNPRIAVHAHDTRESFGTNDDWRDSKQASEIEARGLAPEDAREAAMLVTLQPGTYTAVVDDADGAAGVGLVEVYDLSPSIHSRLANISTRGYVEPGGVLIAGVINGGEGTGNADVVARAVALRFGGETFTPMANPTLEIRDANAQLVAFSDDGQRSGEAGPPPSDFTGAAEVVRLSLPRGAYTAIVWDKNNGPGTTLVEFYDLRR
jgi:hypothetical protein